MKYKIDRYAAVLDAPEATGYPGGDFIEDYADEYDRRNFKTMLEADRVKEWGEQCGWAVTIRQCDEFTIPQPVLTVFAGNDCESPPQVYGFKNIRKAISQADPKQEFAWRLEKDRTRVKHASELPLDTTRSRHLFLRENQYGEQYPALAEYPGSYAIEGPVDLSYRSYSAQIGTPIETFEENRLIQTMNFDIEGAGPSISDGEIELESYPEEDTYKSYYGLTKEEYTERQIERRLHRALLVGMLATFWEIDRALKED